MVNVMKASVEAGSAAERVDETVQEVGARALEIANEIATQPGTAPSPEQVQIGLNLAAQIARARHER